MLLLLIPFNFPICSLNYFYCQEFSHLIILPTLYSYIQPHTHVSALFQQSSTLIVAAAVVVNLYGESIRGGGGQKTNMVMMMVIEFIWKDVIQNPAASGEVLSRMVHLIQFILICSHTILCHNDHSKFVQVFRRASWQQRDGKSKFH